MRWLTALTLLAACTASPCTPDDAPTAEEAPRRGRRNIGGQPHLVLFMVLDTVRSDHTSLCGYERPTTPTLQALLRSGTHTCDAYAPAPWTLPSHASYFTGVPVTEHATMFVGNSDVSINATITARPLDARFETLAETFKARGYQTLAISANSILNDASGLLQGFDHTEISENGLSLRARGLGTALRAKLDALDPEKPLFLFVNAYDAHDPYPAIPPGVDWVPSQPRAKLDAYTKDPNNPYYAFIKGLMPEADRPAFLEQLKNGYDYGIAHADANVAVVINHLHRGGWLEAGYRVVVTSDHGEFLGEHELLRHCGFVWEPVVRVPLIFVDSTRRTRPKFPPAMSALHAYHLVRDGYLPEVATPPHTVSEKNPDDILVGTIAGAVWNGRQKAVCVEGQRAAYDLTADPSEQTPLDLEGSALVPTLDKLCRDIEALHKLPPPKVDPSLTQALLKMGYVDDGATDEAAPLPDARLPTPR